VSNIINSNKITISVDNAADLSPALLKKHNLKTVHFGVVIGGELKSDKTVKPDEIYNAVERDGLFPKTNAALEASYRAVFEGATKDGGSCVHFSISDKMSTSHQNALRAAVGLDRVFVIDTASACAGTGLLAIKASEMAARGYFSAEEIYAAIKTKVEKLNVGFILKDLSYLYRGGRATGLKLIGINILKIRPSLQINSEGRILPCKKYKGNFETTVMDWLKDKLVQTKKADKSLAFVAHSDLSEELAQLAINALINAGFKTVERIEVGTTIAVHVGRNALGIMFLEE